MQPMQCQCTTPMQYQCTTPMQYHCTTTITTNATNATNAIPMHNTNAIPMHNTNAITLHNTTTTTTTWHHVNKGTNIQGKKQPEQQQSDNLIMLKPSFTSGQSVFSSLTCDFEANYLSTTVSTTDDCLKPKTSTMRWLHQKLHSLIF